MQVDNIKQFNSGSINQQAIQGEKAYNNLHNEEDADKKSNTDGLDLENNEKKLLETIEKASGKIEVENKGLEFAIHKGTNQIMVRVINQDTHEVIKELPPEKILDMVAKMVELSGIFIDEKR